MSTTQPLTSDVIVSSKGIPFVVTVATASLLHPRETRRICVRVRGNKAELDEALDAGVLAEIDRRIKGGIEKLEDADADTKFPPDLAVEMADQIEAVLDDHEEEMIREVGEMLGGEA